MDKAAWQAFGEWVEALRKRAGLPIRELADRAEVSEQWLREIRGGGRTVYGEWRLPNPKDEALARLARALNVPVEEMFARAGRGAVGATGDAKTGETAAHQASPEDQAARIRELEARIAKQEGEIAEMRRILEQRRSAM